MPKNGGMMPNTGLKSDVFAHETKPKRPFEERLEAMQEELENLEKKRLKKNLSYRQFLRLHSLEQIVNSSEGIQVS